MFRLAHLSDPHLAPLPVSRRRQLIGKRVLGLLSWRLRRQHIHLTRALAGVLNDIRLQGCDHVAVTGDLVNISLPEEFRIAREWLELLGPGEQVTVVPGNHDAYVFGTWDEGLGRWTPWMTGDGMPPPRSPADFPFVRRRGPVALVGVSSAVPSGPFTATGRVGAPQLEALEARLAELGREGLCRVVLIHHPPQKGGASRRKRLTDAEAFNAVLARAGAELVLHGHLHRSVLGRIPAPAADIPVLGVASASTTIHSHYGSARYHLLGVEPRAEGGWRLSVEVRSLAPDFAGCVSDASFAMDLPRRAA